MSAQFSADEKLYRSEAGSGYPTALRREIACPRIGEDGMNVKRASLVVFVFALAGIGTAEAQTPALGTITYGAAPSPLSPGLPTASLPETAAQAPVHNGPSDYILGNKGDCCGPMGGDGRIDVETFTRLGASMPLDAGYFGKTLGTGWLFEAGGRSLFFNQENDAAWTVELSLANISNHGQRSDQIAVLHNVAVPNSQTAIALGGPSAVSVPVVPVTVRNLNRTMANLGIGREIYLWGPASKCSGDTVSACHGEGCTSNCVADNWRVGFDVGGRWGTEKLELHELNHFTGVVTGVFVALHTDMEIPCGCCVFQLGARVEWDYTFENILPGIDSDLQSLNFMVTMGVRY
jgi:hypothetical protein